MAKSRVQAVAVNTAVGVMQKIVTVICNFAIQIVFIRTLGAQYAGVSALFTSVLTVLAFADLGMGTAIAYNLYRPIAQHDHEKIHAYLRFYGRMYKIVALVVLVGGLICCPLLPYLVKDVPDIRENITVIFMLYVFDTAGSYLLIYKSTFLNACQENFVTSAVHTVVIVVKMVFSIFFLAVLRSFYAYLAFSVLLTLAQNLLISRIADKRYPFLREKSVASLSGGEKKEIYKNMYAMSLYKVSGTALNSADNIIISNMGSTVQVGFLSNQILILRQVYDAVSQFYSAVTSGVGNLSTEDDTAQEYKVFRTLNFVTFWIFLFSATAIFVLSGPVIEWVFGTEYVCTLPVLFVLVLDYFVKGMVNPVSTYRTSHGLFVQGKYRPLIMAILNVVLSILFMKWMGVFGVFLATIVARVLTQVWFDPYIVFKHVFKTSPILYFVQLTLRTIFTLAVGAATYFLAERLTLPSLVLTILVRIVLCLVLPNAVLILCYYRTPEFKQTVSILKRLLSKIVGRLVRK